MEPKVDYHICKISCNKLNLLLLNKLNKLGCMKSYQLLVRVVDADSPLPWDAWISIKDDDEGVEQLVIEGNAGPNGFGYCQVVLPLAEAGDYRIDVENFNGELPDWVLKVADKNQKGRY